MSGQYGFSALAIRGNHDVLKGQMESTCLDTTAIKGSHPRLTSMIYYSDFFYKRNIGGGLAVGTSTDVQQAHIVLT